MSPRRVAIVARLELRLLAGGPLPWALLALAALLGTALNVTTFTSAEAGGPAPRVDSPWASAWLFAMTGFLIYGFFVPLMAGLAVLREDEAGVAELQGATPLTGEEHIVGKLAGVAGVLALVLALQAAIVAALPRLGLSPAGTAHGPLDLGNLLGPALLFVGPATCLLAGLAAWIAERTRQPMAVFALAIGYLFTVPLFMSWAPEGLDPRLDRLLVALDPSGLRWLLRDMFGVDRGVEFYNSEPLVPGLAFRLGRLALVATGLAAAVAAARHRQRHPLARPVGRAVGRRLRTWPGRRRRGASGATGTVASPARAPLQREDLGRPGTPGFPASGVAAARVAEAELRELARRPAVWGLALLSLTSVVEVATSRSGVFGTPLLPTAGSLAVETHGVLVLLLCLVVLFLIVESLVRDRTLRFAPILHSLPVPTGSLLAGKAAAALGVAAAILGLAAAALLVLVAVGGGEADLRPFVLVWGGLLGPSLVLWSAFVLAVQAVGGSRQATYAAGLAVLGSSVWALRLEATSWMTDWTLLGALGWSDLGPFALDREALVLNRLLVLAVALLLGRVAVRAFPRPVRDPLARRRAGRFAPARLGRGALRALPVLLLPALLVGLLDARIRGGFEGPAAAERARRYHLDNVAAWSDVAAPEIVHAELAVALEPDTRHLQVDGRYTLLNATGEPMPVLAFTVRPWVEEVAWSVVGGGLREARPVAVENRSGLHLVRPAEPLAPGARIELGFAFRAVHPRGSGRRGGRAVGQYVLPSGVLLHTLRDSFLPAPGFDPALGAEPGERPAEAVGIRRATPGAGAARPFTTRIALSVPAGWTAVTVGHEVAREEAGGRTRTVWETDHPVRALDVVAGRWEVLREGTEAIYFHPAHRRNAARMLATLSAARARYSEWFGPYPWRELRIVETPAVTTNAMGFPTTVPFSEDLGFLAGRPAAGEEAIDPAFLVTAHEVAHQWWGNVVAPADGPGTGHLVEGMAHYSALALAEAELGSRARAALARRMEAGYLRDRRGSRERPLLEMTDDRHPADWTVVYEKGAWVTWMLRETIGREAMADGLRDFVRRAASSPDPPKTEDLLAVLREHAPDPAAFDRFVDQWLERIVLPEIRLADARVRQVGDGWRISVRVENVGTGSVPVELAVRSAGPSPEAAERRATVVLAPGAPRRVELPLLPLDRPPATLVADPDVRLLQRNRERALLELAP